MTVTAQLAVVFSALQLGVGDLGTPRAPHDKTWSVPFTNGTGLNQADLVWSDTRTLAPSASDSLDLAGGLTDPFGATVTFARIRVLLVIADAGNTNNVIVGGAASNAFASWVGGATHTLTVPPGGLELAAAPGATGYVVTAGTGDILKIANSGAGTSVTYTIVLLGASA